jgi:hypothetical protein
MAEVVKDLALSHFGFIHKCCMCIDYTGREVFTPNRQNLEDSTFGNFTPPTHQGEVS